MIQSISSYLLMHSDELEGLQAEADHWLVAGVELNRFIQDAPEEHNWCRQFIYNYYIFDCTNTSAAHG